MSCTLIGAVLDRYGLGQRRRLVQGRDTPEVRAHSWATPATELRSRQPARIPLNVAHRRDHEIGEVVHLMRDKADRAWAVCRCDIDPGPGPWFYSAETDAARGGTDVVLTGIGLVSRTAQTGLSAVQVLPGRLDDYGARMKWRLDELPGLIIADAVQARRRAGEPLWIRDMRPAGERHAGAYERPRGPLLYRGGGRILRVY